MTPRNALVLALLAAPLFAQQPDQQQPPRDPNRPIKVDPTYQKLADETGGTVYVFDREHPEKMGAIMAADYLAKHALVTTHGEINGFRSFEAALEGNESKLVVTATGSNLKSIELRRPNGSAVVDDGTQNLYTKLGNGGMFVVSNPEAGNWTAVLNGEGNYSVRMNVAPGSDSHRASPAVTTPSPAAADDIEFDGFEFQQIGGRPGHEGLFKIDGYPVAGKTYPVEARISGAFSTVRFEFRSPEGEPLQTLDLKRDREHHLREQRVYTGEVAAPSVPFRINAAGLDQHGNRFQRSLSHLVRPQSFDVEGPGMTEWKPGDSPIVTFTINNYGEAASFEATIVDTAKFLKSDAKVWFSLAGGESRQLEVVFEIPASASATKDSVIVTVQRSGDSNATNHAVIEPSIFKRQP